MTGRWMGKLHGTTESQVMILKLFPSQLLHPCSPVPQDRISLPFQVLQELISPKIVLWAAPDAVTVPAAMEDPSGPRNQVGSCCVHLSG